MPKILVADDNTNIQKMVALAFQERGIDVISVGNGEAAVRRLPDLHPDMVLADIFMPVRNGYEVCEYIKKDPRFAQIPVILLIGAFDPLDEKEARRVGADGVLKKPFIPPDPLIAMVISVLEKNPKIAAELAKAKEKAAAPPEPQLPAVELSANPLTPPKPLPHFPEPSPEEAALIYGFGSGRRAIGDAPAEKTEEPVAPAGATSEEEEFDGALTTRDWRRSAMDFDIPEDAAKQPAFGEEALEPVSAAPVSAASISAPSISEQASGVTAGKNTSAPHLIEGLEIVEAPVAQQAIPEPSPVPFSIPSAAAHTELEPAELPATLQNLDGATESLEDVSGSSVRGQEPESNSWQIESSSPKNDFQDDEIAVQELSFAPQAQADEPPTSGIALNKAIPDDVPVGKALAEDSGKHEKAAGHELHFSEILNRQPALETEPGRAATPEPSFTSRVRSWMDAISPSGNPEGGWLASVANVLSSGDKAKHHESPVVEPENSSVAVEPASEKQPLPTVLSDEAAAAQQAPVVSVEAPAAKPASPVLLSEASPFEDVVEEPFFLDEDLGTSTSPSPVDSLAMAPVIAEKSEDQTQEWELVAATPAQASGIATESEAGNLPSAPFEITGSRAEHEAAPHQSILFKDPNLIEPPAVAVTPEPLLIDEDAPSRQPSEYRPRRQELPPMYSFLTPVPTEPAAIEASDAAPREAQGAAWEWKREEPLEIVRKDAGGDVLQASTPVEPAEEELGVASVPSESSNESRDSWEAPQSISQKHPASWQVESEVLPGVLSEAPLPQPPALERREEVSAQENASFESTFERKESEQNEWTPTAPPPNLEALREIPFLTPPREFLVQNAEEVAQASAASVNAVAKEMMVDEVVRKVLDRLEPRLHDLLAQGLLKPLIESIIHEESERK